MLNIIKKPKVSNVFCDKISMTTKVDESDKPHVISAFENLINIGSTTYAPTLSYRYSRKLEIMGFDTSTFIQCFPNNEKAAFFRAEFNPNRLGELGLAELKWRLDGLFPCGFEYFIQESTCTRVDTAIDVQYIKIDEIAYRYPSMQLSKAYYASGKTAEHWNDIQSYYIGGETGKSPLICIYDKSAQVKKYNSRNPDNPVKVPKHPTVRIETRHRKRFPLSELPKLPNLFHNLSLYAFHKIPANDWVFNMFVKNIRSEGAQNALLSVPDNGTRAKYRKRLEQAVPDFWLPEEHWKCWKDVANRILSPPDFHPESMQLIAPPKLKYVELNSLTKCN